MEKWLIPGLRVRNAYEPGAAYCARVRQGSKGKEQAQPRTQEPWNEGAEPSQDNLSQ